MKRILLIIFCTLSLIRIGTAQWQPINDGIKIGIRSIAIDPTTNFIYAGTFASGIFVSPNNGLNWISKNKGFSSLPNEVTSIVIDGPNIFAGTWGRGVFLSTNNGNSWSSVNNGISNMNIYQLALNGNDVIAVSQNGIFLSLNKGSSWSTMNNGLLNTNVNSISICGGKIFVGTGNGVFISTNNGQSWAEANNGLSNKWVLSLANKDNIIFLGTAGSGIFKSSDGGNTWVEASIGLPANSWILTIVTNGNNIYAGTAESGVFISTNNGTSWVQLNNNLTSYSVTAICKDQSNLFMGTWENGVFLSKDDGNTWNSMNDGFTVNVMSLAKEGNSSYAGTYGYGIYLSTNNGIKWTEVNYGLPSPAFVNSIAITDNNIFAGTSEGVYLSTNNGSSWTAASNGLSGYEMTWIHFAIKGNSLFAGTASGVFISTDYGNNWTQVNNGLTGKGLNTMDLAINGNNLFLGTYGAGVFISSDNGNSWKSINNGLPGLNPIIYSVTSYGNNVYATVKDYGVFISTDNGDNWTSINKGLEGQLVRTITVCGNNLFAGSWGGGVYFSADNGNRWAEVNRGLSEQGKYVQKITCDGINVFIGTYGGGIWKRSISDISNLDIHFVPVWSGSGIDYMHLYALTAKLDNIDLQPGDEIGIFDGNVCVGMKTLTKVLSGSVYLPMVVSKDDPDTPEKDGYTESNKISYKIWDSSARYEVGNVQAEYVTGTGIFSYGTTASFNLTAFNSITQTLNLTTGWNILSFAVQPTDMSMLSIFNPLITAGTLVKVQDEKGNAIEKLPAPIGWVDNIGQMKLSEGYKIKVTGNTSSSFTGLPVSLPQSITLDAGWNIMGYPSMSSQPVLTAFNGLITAGSLLKVQDEQGNAIEKLPAPIGWIDNIHNLLPGKGYKIKTNANTTLTINNSGKGENQFTETAINSPAHFKPVYKGNGLDQMNIYVQSPTIDGLALKAGDEIGVFDGGRCVGAVIVDDPNLGYYTIIASVDDPTTKDADGFTEGNVFDLKLWNAQTGSEGKVQRVEYQKGYNKYFEKLGTSVLTVDFTKESINVLGDAFPNPSSEKTTFTFQLAMESQVQLGIYDINGNLIKLLIDKKMPGGKHKIEWDNRSANGVKASSGIYFYRLKLNDFLQTRQLVIR